MAEIALFALHGSESLGERVSRQLGIPLSPHEEREFEDGEHKIRPLQPVTGRHVYVIQSLHGDAAASPNDRLCRLLFLVGALRDAGAARVTILAPYLCYARKDRRTKPFDPVTNRYVATLFEAMGTDAVVTLDVHNVAAFENAFRCPTRHLEPGELFARHLAPTIADRPVVVVAPDAGAAKRAESLRRHLEKLLQRPIGRAMMEKSRSEGVVSGEALYGDVAGACAIVADDIIATGTTMLRAARAGRRAGAMALYAVASHGLFRPGTSALASEGGFDRVIVTDSVPNCGETGAGLGDRLTVLDCAELFAGAVRDMTAGAAPPPGATSGPSLGR